MNMTPSINFVIWGIRNGFSRNILASINTPEEVLAVLNDDLRQVCSGTIDVFYLIQKTSRFSLISIVNPNTKDHVGRKAYIVISLYFPKEYTLSTDAVAVLDSLMKYYSDKQGSAMANMITEDMFAQQLDGVSLIQESRIQSYYSGDKKGYFVFESKEKLSEIYKSLNIRPYSKIICHGGQFEPNQLPGYEKAELSKNVLICFKDFSTDKHIFRLNEKQLYESGNSIEIYASPGDSIRVYSKHQHIDKTIYVKESMSGMTYTPNDLFPIKDTTGYSSGNVMKNNFELVSNKTLRRRKIKKLLFLSIVFLFIAAGGYFLYPLVFENDEKCENNETKGLGYKWIRGDGNYSGKYFFYYNEQWMVNTDTVSCGWQQADSNMIIYLEDRNKLNENTDSSITVDSEEGFETYDVKKSDKLDIIAKNLNVSKDSLIRWNSIKDPNNIKAGEKLQYKPTVVDSRVSLTESQINNSPVISTENRDVNTERKSTEDKCSEWKYQYQQYMKIVNNPNSSKDQKEVNQDQANKLKTLMSENGCNPN